MGKKPAPRSPSPARRWALGSGSQALSFAQRKEMAGKETQTKKGKKKKKEPQNPKTRPSPEKTSARAEREMRKWELERRALEQGTGFRYVVSLSY